MADAVGMHSVGKCGNTDQILLVKFWISKSLQIYQGHLHYFGTHHSNLQDFLEGSNAQQYFFFMKVIERVQNLKT